MIIGVPRERKQGERRVAITPDGVQDLTRKGHKVLVEKNAGDLSGFKNEAFRAAGAQIAETLDEIWNTAQLIVKVKEPAPEEEKLFRPGLAVFSFLHLAVAPDLTKAMAKSGVTGLDYDLVMLDDGRLPLLEPMSIIAGKLAMQCGAYSLQAGSGGCGVLLGGCVGVRPGSVVVIGAGAAGSSAARVALGMGAEVTVLDINISRLAPFADFQPRARTLYSTPSAILREIKEADIVVGAVLIPGALAPKLIKRDYVSQMKPGSVIVDICIDQGGISETSHSTSIAEPTYVESGVIHYCVPNMPALVPRTSTEALTSATLPYVKLLAENGIEQALKLSAPLRRSLTSYRGHLTNSVIGEAVGLKSLSDIQVDQMIYEDKSSPSLVANS